MGRNTRSGLNSRGPQKMAKGKPLQDPEFWLPDPEFAAGRPRVVTNRTHRDFPAPTPQDTECVLWQGPVDRYGYGVKSVRRRTERDAKRVRAHRFAWVEAHGAIPEGMVVRHMCDNRVCVNVDHLELGTQADNVRDASERGHLGAVRALTPSQVREIMARRGAGETWASIHRDFSEFGLTTVRRAMVYADDV